MIGLYEPAVTFADDPWPPLVRCTECGRILAGNDTEGQQAHADGICGEVAQAAGRKA